MSAGSTSGIESSGNILGAIYIPEWVALPALVQKMSLLSRHRVLRCLAVAAPSERDNQDWPTLSQQLTITGTALTCYQPNERDWQNTTA